MQNRRKKGHFYESQVADWLDQKLGWETLSRNVRIFGVECDLLMRDREQKTWWIEVKYRHSASSSLAPLISVFQKSRQIRALKKLRMGRHSKACRWGLIYINERGDIEFVENTCYL